MAAIVVKIGGKAAENRESLGALCDELLALSREQQLVLGARRRRGGHRASRGSSGSRRCSRTACARPRRQEMDIVDMVLAGKVNKQLVRLLRTRGPGRGRA